MGLQINKFSIKLLQADVVLYATSPHVIVSPPVILQLLPFLFVMFCIVLPSGATQTVSSPPAYPATKPSMANSSYRNEKQSEYATQNCNGHNHAIGSNHAFIYYTIAYVLPLPPVILCIPPIQKKDSL